MLKFLNIMIELTVVSDYNRYVRDMFDKALSLFEKIKKFLAILIKYQTIYTKIVYNSYHGGMVCRTIAAMLTTLKNY